VAGTLVLTTADKGRGVTEYQFAWTSTAGGAVSGNTQNVKAGTIVGAKFKPGTSGSQPTDLYDVTLVDADSVDVLVGTGANLSNATTTRAVPHLSTYGKVYFEGGTLDLVVANAGSAKSGTVYLWVKDGAP
jgi:hypothetical protein